MKVMMNEPFALCAILFFGSAAGRVGHIQSAPSPAASPSAAPGGPAAAPGAAVESHTCEFTIKNLDYEAVAEHDEARDGIRASVKDMIDKNLEAAIAGPGAPSAAPAPGPPAGPAAAPAFIELRSKPKIFAKSEPQSALVHHAQRSVTVGPAPSPGGSPASSPAPDNVETFVALSEGPKDSVDVKVWSITGPENDDKVEAGMKKACNSAQLANALLGADGMHWKHAPVVIHVKAGTSTIEPFQLDCAPHVKKIISRFSVAYTRAQVPHAMEEACHLFESKISFSGNHRITKWDKRVCKKATEKLMNTWQGGKGKENYEEWCHDICEMKLGKGAPQCHI